MEKDFTVILALYPNSRGLGFACIKTPKKLVDLGMIRVMPLCNEKIAARALKFLSYYRPTLVVLRGYDEPVNGKSKRIVGLLQRMVDCAKAHSIPFYQYSRRQMQEAFELFGATTKMEIVQKILEWLPELEKHAPKLQPWYMPENHNMGIFDALALSFTHQYLS